LPVRVELAEDAVIKFEETRHEEVRFTRSQLDRAFRTGLMQPPRTSERDPDVPAGVTVTGDVKFLVGHVDLGVDLGMEVLVRGLDAAIDAVTRDDRKLPAEGEAPDVERKPSEDEPGDHEPGDEPNPREILIPAHEAGDRLDDLLGEIEPGVHVVLVDDGRRVAVLMGWSDYVGLREKLAAAAVAFWTAWRTGEFDVAGYATEVATILHRPGTKRAPAPADGQEGPATGAGGDERIR
jgi:antitoxin (DNA-binding transcriptional repressor) of toxin-antitoxin stability system